MPRLLVRIEGLEPTLAKIRSSELYAGPWREALTKITELGVAQGQRNAPVATGHMRGSIVGKISPAMVPLSAVITASGTSKSGVRYPFVLQAGHRARKSSPEYERWKRTRRKGGLSLSRAGESGNIILHYRGRRRSTRGWFTRGMRRVRDQAGDLLREAANKIEAGWGRR